MWRRNLLAALACSVAPFALAPAIAQVNVRVNVGPPPPRREAVPPPRRGYTWVPGHWDWNGRRHTWVAGTWIRARPGYAYAQPRWIERDGRWEMRRGYWRRGDRDGDGVPNRNDRAPDNPRRQ
jgi:WXXGXW repeat (2 copies)